MLPRPRNAICVIVVFRLAVWLIEATTDNPYIHGEC
jgi:hypothetical protein